MMNGKKLFYIIMATIISTSLYFGKVPAIGGGNMITENKNICKKIREVSKLEDWKMATLREINTKSGISIYSFKNNKTSIIYKAPTFSLEDPWVIISNDARKIGFWLTKSNGMRSLYIIDYNGANLEKIIDVYEGQNICWSPDNKKIAFVGKLEEGQKENKYSLYIIDTKTKKLDILLNNVDYITNQSWSPDGSALVYGVIEGENELFKIYNINTKLMIDGATNGSWPMWSPDGKWISYLGEDGIRIITPDGAKSELLVKDETQFNSTSMHGMIMTPFFWLPNGRFIIYGKCLTEHCEIGTPFVVDIISKQIEQLPEENWFWLLSSWARAK